MTSRYDQLNDRARWFLNNFDEIDLADTCASQEASNQARQTEIEQLREQLSTRDAAISVYTDQMRLDQQRLARVHDLRAIWQKAAAAKDDAVILVGVAADMLYGALQPAPAVVSAPVQPTTRTDDEADADTVANRAAKVITNMGADIRTLTKQRDRYRTAWCSARERAKAYGEGILRVVKDRESYQEWLRQAEDRNAALLRRMAGEEQPTTKTGPAPQDSTERCTHCSHPKRDHDGRADHREKYSPLVAGEPWCHACNATCDYDSDEQPAVVARQDGATT